MMDEWNQQTVKNISLSGVGDTTSINGEINREAILWQTFKKMKNSRGHG